MPEPTNTRDHVRVLNGIAHCAHCGAPLLKAGPNYSCPTVITDRTDACPTNPIDGQELLHLVVERIISRTINDQTMDQIVVTLKNDYGKQAQKSQDDLDRTESRHSGTERTKVQHRVPRRTGNTVVRRRGRED